MHFAGPAALAYGLVRPLIWASLFYVIFHSRHLGNPCKPLLLFATVGLMMASIASAFPLAGYDVGVFQDLTNVVSTPLLGIFVGGWAIAAAKFEGFRGPR